MSTRALIQVCGTVQGVGFRPYVHSLAKRRGLRGQVLNNEAGVLIDLEGEHDAIDGFVAELQTSPPLLSSIESLSRHDGPSMDLFEDFTILPSRRNGSTLLPVAADSAVCEDCVRELFDRADRRHRYPFLNCTNCGPRFTIIERVPYDRERTTMREFTMCAACLTEYEDPLNRRFHAEPIACADCGPTLVLTRSTGGYDRSPDVIHRTRELIDEGKIIAIKSLGGFHLVVDAMNADAVGQLRKRKLREDKPFAVMARSVDIVERFCDVSEKEKALLTSRERPIVLLAKKDDASLPDEVAPAVVTFGFMLPYTPLHHLLFEDLDRPLVMTSGNVSDEPIAYRVTDAFARLKDIADYFLTNDRRIQMRTDDSIVRLNRSTARPIVLRRSRGYAPTPLRTSINFERQILACGAELKNTFCIARGNHAFLSQHIGDLENLETLRSFTDGIEHFKQLFNLSPEVIAHDLHPEYLSTKWAHSCDDIEIKIGVQHHHAHIASCLVDNDAEGEVIGVAMDGLGFGVDGKLWGCEFFVADLTTAERVAHLDYVPMPGGTAAIREPWRMAAVYLYEAFGDQFLDLDLPFTRELNRASWRTLRSMIATGTNSPQTSSMGRLFDAVSAMLSLRSTVNYEGQAAIALESIANRTAAAGYRFEVDAGGTIRAQPVIRAAVEDILNGAGSGEVSAKFHLAIADLIADIAIDVRDKRGLQRVALSGGVFQNMFLFEATLAKLAQRDFEVLTHSRIPTNDGGISLGQAAVANARILAGRI